MAGAPFAVPASRPGTVTVIVTVLRDPRVQRTLESLLAQRRLPDQILVDDGSGADGRVREISSAYSQRDARVQHLDAPGNIATSRNSALRAATGEFIAFVDADEIARPDWLQELLRAFDDPNVGFAGGPTPALAGTARTIGAKFYDGFLRRFYATVARRQAHAIPMGNSAWRAELFRRLGPLDESLLGRIGNEDQEFAVRCLRAGWQGLYVPEAVVDHDFSDITLLALLRKQRRYAEGGYLVWRRAGTTYEATALRLAPYLVPPGLLVVGLLLAAASPALREAGAIVAVAGLLALGALAVALTIVGLREDVAYPGLKYNALEILRRWATIVGATIGALRSLATPAGRRRRSLPKP